MWDTNFFHSGENHRQGQQKKGFNVEKGVEIKQTRRENDSVRIAQEKSVPISQAV